MARRDRVTRRTARIDRINSETLGRKYQTPIRTTNAIPSRPNAEESAQRPRGRRGVRARARDARIANLASGNSDVKRGSGS